MPVITLQVYMSPFLVVVEDVYLLTNVLYFLSRQYMKFIGTQPDSEACYDQFLHLMKMVSVKAL